MTDVFSNCQTVLLIGLGTRAVPNRSVSGLPDLQHTEQLSFIEAALSSCGAGHITRIGDNALIAAFPTADSAFAAACSLQQSCRQSGHDAALTDVRILIDRSSGDFAGDGAQEKLNEVCPGAEVLMDKVPAGQIVATGDVTGHLDELSHGRFHLYEPESAGANADKLLCQVICNEETITRLAIPTRYEERSTAPRSLNLRWRENTMTVVPESPPLTIGRGDQTDVQIKSELASRIHARLAFQHSNFILTDQSTNGTFIQIDEDDVVYLHHEQIVLRGHGVIGLGRHVRAGGGKLIYFKLAP